MIRFTVALSAILLPSLAFAGGPLCVNGVACNSHAKVVQFHQQFQTAFATPVGYPAVPLFSVPVATPAQNYYGGTVSNQYKQTADAEKSEAHRRLEKKIDILLSSLVDQGKLSTVAFAEASQQTINTFCVGCHRSANPSEGKGFALTDLAQLTPDQHKLIIKRIMTKDESLQMPPAKSQQRKNWTAEAAGEALSEVAEAKTKSDVPVEVK